MNAGGGLRPLQLPMCSMELIKRRVLARKGVNEEAIETVNSFLGSIGL